MIVQSLGGLSRYRKLAIVFIGADGISRELTIYAVNRTWTIAEPRERELDIVNKPVVIDRAGRQRRRRRCGPCRARTQSTTNYGATYDTWKDALLTPYGRADPTADDGAA